ncbi:methyltransferase domain-containing protein [Georgenia sp. EYE_87]|uniref:methyltransferase domain-containing protein n=1 Tax=Georgenia sp. EYE_87 TaxID=2853448 RepID=UPI0020042D44|nr:methyltransferase domain-containing protein [Georgenia sp. EYE_87]MCK6211602.1 methyltransferase domain-containing protein [Georgenia sp. EYE_87]
MSLRTAVDVVDLEARVKAMYSAVATHPEAAYHFELGRPLAERLGYPAETLDRLPAAAVDSFAGVGYFFDLADLRLGEAVLDLGSGSGTDSFVAATQVGPTGRVVGVDLTTAQLAKAATLAAGAGLAVELVEGRIEDLPFPDASFDAVISNGVVNLSPDKARVFAEAARVLRPGGRLVLADIVSETALGDAITADAELWAACIGGAAQVEEYLGAIEAAGLQVERRRDNPYRFVSARAQRASSRYGVRSVTVLARRPLSRPA